MIEKRQSEKEGERNKVRGAWRGKGGERDKETEMKGEKCRGREGKGGRDRGRVKKVEIKRERWRGRKRDSDREKETEKRRQRQRERWREGRRWQGNWGGGRDKVKQMKRESDKETDMKREIERDRDEERRRLKDLFVVSKWRFCNGYFENEDEGRLSKIIFIHFFTLLSTAQEGEMRNLQFCLCLFILDQDFREVIHTRIIACLLQLWLL